ncbi:hypothetical protein Hrd1104_00455 [Halorhabdus sp. CBA1104]|uniref:DUF7529 family protein n=1 Tax=unclassified Halorhabdus TaxID=2621901 RepID=UPI0012B42705|nr:MULTISPECIES: hypothetical protein [unclassified Halorhabdus]QGN05912.1 hypothetical protein Hrd1104_00455 [Halorhabdus sp. CBA1104]
MVRLGPDDVSLDDGERLLATSEQAHSGWEQTLQDAEAMARDRAANGFETLVLTSDDTTPKPPDSGEDEEWGLVYIVPSNQAGELESFADRATFEETVVYQATSSGHAFVVTECLDLDEQLALFVAGTYRMQHAPPLVRAALEREKMFTHVKQLDGTPVGTIEHDDPEQFFPDPEQFYAFEM